MAATYVKISEEQFRAEMDDMGFEQVTGRRGELVFQRQVDDRDYAVRIFTSVLRGESKDCGKDAIRIGLIDLKAPKPYLLKVLGEARDAKAGKRINRSCAETITNPDERVANVLNRVRARCRDYWKHVLMHECPECGSAMAIREGKFGKFLGCLRFREGCRGSKNLPREAA